MSWFDSGAPAFVLRNWRDTSQEVKDSNPIDQIQKQLPLHPGALDPAPLHS